MITKLCKGIRKREVITSPGVGPYTTNQKVTYWIESDKKGIMDSQWHEAAWERLQSKAMKRHIDLVRRFMADGWKEESGKTLEEVIRSISKTKEKDAPVIHRSEKDISKLRAKGGRTAQARARARKAAE